MRPICVLGFAISALFTLGASFLLVVNIPDTVGMVRGTRHTNDVAFFYFFVFWLVLGVIASFVFWLLSKPTPSEVWDFLSIAFVALFGWTCWFFITRLTHSFDLWDFMPMALISAAIALLLWKRYRARRAWVLGLSILLVIVGSPLLLLELASR